MDEDQLREWESRLIHKEKELIEWEKRLQSKSKLVRSTRIKSLDRKVLSQLYDPSELNLLFKAEMIIRRYIYRKRFKNLVSSATKSPIMQQVKRRMLALSEILSTEQSYVKDLQVCLRYYMVPIVQRGLLTSEEVSIVFGDLEIILLLNQPFMEQLEEKCNQWPCTTVGDLFTVIAPLMKIYSRFILNYDTIMSCLTKAKSDNSTLVTFLRDTSMNIPKYLDLESFLIMPVQRLPRYKMLLENLQKLTPTEHTDYANIGQAIAKVDGVIISINESRRAVELEVKLHENIPSEARPKLTRQISNIRPIGEIVVIVHGGKDLKAMDFVGTSDPYCVIKLNEQVVKTKVVKKTLHPKWEEQFSLYATSETGRVIVEVYDWERLGQVGIGSACLTSKHKLIGETSIDLAGIPRNSSAGPEMHKIKNEVEETGEILLTLRWNKSVK